MQLPITVAIDFMNQDHADFVKLIIQLDTALENESDEKISHIMAQLFKHTVEHFSHEESEMQRINFPPYPMHKGEHEQVIDLLNNAVAHWENEHDRALLNQFITETILPWFYLHVETMDSITAQFIQQFDSTT